jgi:alpha-glucosidase
MCPYNAAKYKETIDESLKQVKETESSTTWVLSNHDVSRYQQRLS